MKKYKTAAILMLIHGGMIELGGGLAALLAQFLPGGAAQMDAYFGFCMPYLQENLNLVLLMGGIYGALRVTAAVGLLKNRLWGLALGIINCVVTLALMIFMLPAGILDGILAGSALLLMLWQYFGQREIGGIAK
ncbi:hypothetical protein AALG83_08395 [Christensenellaceae bacterium 44-20]